MEKESPKTKPESSPAPTNKPEQAPGDITGAFLIGCLQPPLPNAMAAKSYNCYLTKNSQMFTDQREISNVAIKINDPAVDPSSVAEITVSGATNSFVRFSVVVQYPYWIVGLTADITDPVTNASEKVTNNLPDTTGDEAGMRLMYLSSVQTNGDIGGIDIARSICAANTPFEGSPDVQAAITPVLNYTTGDNAASWLKVNARADLISPSGKLLISAAQIDGGTDITLNNSLYEDFWGQPLNTNTPNAMGVWTGFGAMKPGPSLRINMPSCPDTFGNFWSNANSMSVGIYGNSLSPTDWLMFDPTGLTDSAISCDNQLRLLCIL